MIEDSYLPFFITEELYIVEQGDSVQTTQPASIQSTSIAEDPVPQKAEEPKETLSTPSIPISKPTPPKVHELAIWTPPLTSNDRELLVKILGAIKKDFNQAHLMEGINNYSPHYKKLLCFGYNKELELKLGNEMTLYIPTDHASQQILCSVAPAELHSDASQKKRLWEALQKMFL
ncbi:MAG: hypothetical protein RIC35_06435 [Marinoscillum sp.]